MTADWLFTLDKGRAHARELTDFTFSSIVFVLQHSAKIKMKNFLVNE